MSRYGKPANVSAPKQPKWTGENEEWPIAISRGEPCRTDAQMFSIITKQFHDYLSQFPGPEGFDGEVTAAAAYQAAKDHIFPAGSQSMRLSRVQVLRYVVIARKQLLATGWLPIQERLTEAARRDPDQPD